MGASSDYPLRTDIEFALPTMKWPAPLQSLIGRICGKNVCVGHFEACSAFRLQQSYTRFSHSRAGDEPIHLPPHPPCRFLTYRHAKKNRGLPGGIEVDG